MNEIIKRTVLPNRWGFTTQEKELVTITGSLTSQIQLKAKDYAFVKLKNPDPPVIFKQKPPIAKSSLASLTGNQKLKKECFGCGDKFTTTKRCDYCSNCAINGNRYIFGRFTKNYCPECGDGSGLIKFSNQPPRACKLCPLPQAQIIHHG